MSELYAILVPVYYGPMPGPNTDGLRITPAHLRDFAALCVQKTGGLTASPNCKGLWLDPNDGPTSKLYSEPMTPYMVMTDLATALELAQAVKTMFQQKAVMYYRVSDSCHIV